VICEICYSDLQAQAESRQRQREAEWSQQEAERKIRATKDFIKYLIASLWTAGLGLAGIVGYLANQRSGGAWFGLFLLWAVGGAPAALLSGAFKRTREDDIASGVAWGTGNTEQGCILMLGRFLGIILISAIACPFMSIYFIYKTVVAYRSRK